MNELPKHKNWEQTSGFLYPTVYFLSICCITSFHCFCCCLGPKHPSCTSFAVLKQPSSTNCLKRFVLDMHGRLTRGQHLFSSWVGILAQCPSYATQVDRCLVLVQVGSHSHANTNSPFTTSPYAPGCLLGSSMV